MSGHRVANARLAAVEAIASVLDDQCSLADRFTDLSGLSSRDRAFAQHLAYGVLRWLSALEWLAGQLLDRPLKRRDRDISRLVMIGLFQLWKDDTADHAAVHSSAECARLLGKNWATGLINALLRRFQRERRTLLQELAKTTARHAHPDWLLDRFRDDWPERWESITSGNNRQPPLWLRVNRRRAAMDEIIAELSSEGYSVGLHPEASDAVVIEPAAPVHRIPGFSEGRVSVQDPAAQLAVEYLSPSAGERILDACGAPGGKTCHLLERQPGVELTVLDRDQKRARLIHENLQRLGLECRVQTADAACPDQWWDGRPFHKILLDAPCSTTGVIRRHPEIKWLRDPGQVANANRIQRNLLDRLWPLLDTGGILVYATCSVLKIENNEQIHDFLSRHPNAVPAGPAGRSSPETALGRQILPGEEDMDGFYYAILRKRP